MLNTVSLRGGALVIQTKVHYGGTEGTVPNASAVDLGRSNPSPQQRAWYQKDHYPSDA